MNLFHYRTLMPRGLWALCGEETGYGLFKTQKPKAIAEKLIHEVFTEEEIANKVFYYYPHYYRGKNNLQDRIEVYYKN